MICQPYISNQKALGAGRTAALCLLAVGSLMLQGCLAGAWLAAVSVDSVRNTEDTFRPFEQSWVSTERPSEILGGSSLTSVAVAPVEGDDEMASRLSTILQRQTALRVELSSPAHQAAPGLSDDDTKRAETARSLSRELIVDAVLFGRVADAERHPSDWGWNNKELCRLYLYLVDRDGHLLWKDELPFTVIPGSKPPLEHSMQAALDRHLMNHVRDLGLDSIGYFPPRNS
ncbi:hypothetical protein [Petrachloros mirabilis]